MYYTIDTLKQYLDLFNVSKIKTKSKNKISYYNIPCTFDIEVTSAYHNNENNECLTSQSIALLKENQGDNFNESKYTKIAFMYIWMLSIDDNIIIGRTWEEFNIVMNSIAKLFNLGENCRMIIYVRNLSFEFNFLKSRMNFVKVFATESHKIVYGITENGFEFKCSYFLSGCSLETTGNNLVKYKANKMVGDLDYNKIRTWKTPLTDKEIGYCLNDVIVDSNFIRESMEQEKGGSIIKLPLTKTGYVRRYCKEYCLNEDNKTEYSKIIRNFKLDSERYYQLKRAYSGAFTHANAFNVDKVFNDVSSDDFTSSYPAVLIMEKYPMGKPYKYTPKDTKDFANNLTMYCCIFDCTFYNIRQKENVWESIISSSKCFNKVNELVNNGRIVEAEEITITLTDVDFLNIKQFYDFDRIKISNFVRYSKGYLPKPLIECIIKFYKDKTTLKDVEGKENEYLLGKSIVNAIYGMMVTDPVKNNYTINENKLWQCEETEINEALKRYNESSSRFIAYEWGIWCTAYARRNLFTAIKELGADFIYSDTDSVKYLNRENHLNYFNNYNKLVIYKLHQMCDYYNISYDNVSPKTIKGKRKTIGLWEYEGTYQSFKTLGAKRYAYLKDNEFNITVAGVNKKEAVPYMLDTAKRENINVFDLFNDKLFFGCEHSGKMLHSYIDYSIDYMITDYLGNTAEVVEYSGVHLEPTSYSLNILDEYIKYFKGIQTNLVKC